MKGVDKLIEQTNKEIVARARKAKLHEAKLQNYVSRYHQTQDVMTYGKHLESYFPMFVSLLYHAGIGDVNIGRRVQSSAKTALNFLAAYKDCGDGRTPSGRNIELKISNDFRGKGAWYLKHLKPYDSHQYIFDCSDNRVEKITDYLLFLNVFENGTFVWNNFFIPSVTLYEMGNRYEMFKASSSGSANTNLSNTKIEQQLTIFPDTQFWYEIKQYKLTFAELVNKLDERPALPHHIMAASVNEFLD